MKKRISFYMLLLVFNFLVFSSIPVIDTEKHSTLLTALWVEKPEKTHISFHEFDEINTEFWAGFKAEKGQEIKIVVAVPKIEKYVDFKFKLILMGPSIEEGFKWGYFTEDEYLLDKIQLNWGSKVYLSSSEDALEFSEPLTGIASWVRINEIFRAPSKGDYFLMIIPEEKKDNGKIELILGSEIEFNITDILRIPEWREYIQKFHMGG